MSQPTSVSNVNLSGLKKSSVKKTLGSGKFSENKTPFPRASVCFISHISKTVVELLSPYDSCSGS